MFCRESIDKYGIDFGKDLARTIVEANEASFLAERV